MDPAFMPSTLVVKHFVEHNHKFTIEFGPSITSLGRGIRNVILISVVVWGLCDIARASMQAVLKRQPARDP